MRVYYIGLLAVALGISACSREKATVVPHGLGHALYQCGDLKVYAEFYGDGRATLAFDYRMLTLQQVPAASGAKYTDAAGNEFWTKDGARLTLAGQPIRRCTLT